MLILLAFLIGVIAGLRSMTAPAAIAWAAWLGWLNLSGSWLAFMGATWAVGLFTILAVGELIVDQLPSTPSRTAPPPLAARLIMGALCGFAIGAPHGGGLAGVIGAGAGAYGGAAVRARLAEGFGKDRPAAFVEDAVAILAAGLVIAAAA
ncbi:Uncharacterized membrane protein [Rhodoblastus acidophilus]|uniref:Uncharacterized membrane protein n=1 Tax=Rhodoblastus acidophilus TaxID=1074 RepID=A0A212R0C9_RHOAC|nr:DUF4126 domain-containing protein [Rhodoblastus acidophilus]PPQ40477.1 DUF4126 domain-containing protein [Rhodoblastus acidophilus]RAI23037.1 DUF4126 domain-containing protein [Rhodoblastus acidophilus]SNB65419.1 Uncharacterized membrane protein [Rhodoblastus acidophilus]